MQDLLTSKEIKNLAIRLRIAKLLLKGKTHNEIVKTLHTSFGTVAKVSIWLSKGGQGFRKTISKLPVRYKFPKKLPPVPIEFHLPQVLMTLAEYAVSKNQNIKLEKFIAGVQDKRATDKFIRKYLSEKYNNSKMQ